MTAADLRWMMMADHLRGAIAVARLTLPIRRRPNQRRQRRLQNQTHKVRSAAALLTSQLQAALRDRNNFLIPKKMLYITPNKT
jgi:hypothetical protein